MARIKFEDIKKIGKLHPVNQKVAICTFSTYELYGGKIIQIDTYGSKIRMDQGKISQTIQLNASSAEHLVRLLMDEFNLNPKKINKIIPNYVK